MFGSRGRNREVTGSNPGRDELDTDPIVVAAFEDNSFSARGAGTVRTWFNERVSRLGFHDEDGKKHKTFKTRSEKESSRQGPPDEASDEGQLADLLALTAGCDELVVTGPDGDLGGVAAAVFGAVTGRVARKPGDSCVDKRSTSVRISTSVLDDAGSWRRRRRWRGRRGGVLSRRGW